MGNINCINQYTSKLHAPSTEPNKHNNSANHQTNPVVGWRQWHQLQLALLLRQEEQGLLLLRGHGGCQRDPWAGEDLPVSQDTIHITSQRDKKDAGIFWSRLFCVQAILILTITFLTSLALALPILDTVFLILTVLILRFWSCKSMISPSLSSSLKLKLCALIAEPLPLLLIFFLIYISSNLISYFQPKFCTSTSEPLPDLPLLLNLHPLLPHHLLGEKDKRSKAVSS